MHMHQNEPTVRLRANSGTAPQSGLQCCAAALIAAVLLASGCSSQSDVPPAPTAASTSTPESTSTATSAPSNVADVPVSAATPDVGEILQEAKVLAESGRGGSGEFIESIRSIADEFPVLEVSTDNQVKWQTIKINDTGVGFAAIRFTSPLDAPADMHWVFVLPPDAIEQWYIVPREGTMDGFRNFENYYDLSLPDVSLPASNLAVFQELLEGQIQPGREYILWFGLNSSEAVELRVALHLEPMATRLFATKVDELATAIGIELPKKDSPLLMAVRDAMSRVAATKVVPASNSPANSGGSQPSSGNRAAARTSEIPAMDAISAGELQAALASNGPQSIVPELETLAPFAGTWKGTFTNVDGTNLPLVVSSRWILGGFLLLTEYRIDSPTPIRGASVLTFDEDQEVFRQWAFDNTGPVSAPNIFTGDSNDSGELVLTREEAAANGATTISLSVSENKMKWKLMLSAASDGTMSEQSAEADRVEQGSAEAAEIQKSLAIGPVTDIAQLQPLNRFAGLWQGAIATGPRVVRIVIDSEWLVGGAVLLTRYQFKFGDFLQNGATIGYVDPVSGEFKSLDFDTGETAVPSLNVRAGTGAWNDSQTQFVLTVRYTNEPRAIIRTLDFLNDNQMQNTIAVKHDAADPQVAYRALLTRTPRE